MKCLYVCVRADNALPNEVFVSASFVYSLLLLENDAHLFDNNPLVLVLQPLQDVCAAAADFLAFG